MINYLITGGAGFIGSELVRNLNKYDNSNILNIDKLTYAGSVESINNIQFNKRYKFRKLDICNQSDMENVFNNFKPQVVYHLAAETHVDRSIDDPTKFLNTNVLGTASMLNAALQYWDKLDIDKKNTFKFISVSTDEVFGSLEDNNFFNEQSPYMPNSPYSASKASSDHLVRAWNKTYNLPTIITNCSNNYGPFQYPEKLIPLIIINAIKINKLPIYGDGKNIRDWLHVSDHVSALIKIGQRGKVGESYNIGGNCQISNLEVVEKICNILDESNVQKSKINTFKDLITFVKDRPGHDRRYAINFSKLTNEIGWVPKKSFDQGLIDTVNWYVDNYHWWKKIISKNSF
jgi:dTDP-glucose 4,6-dehydratase